MATSGSTDSTLAEIEAEDLRRRLAALEADMAGSRKERVTKEALLERYAYFGPVDAGPSPAEGSFTWKIQQAQNNARERNRRAAERHAKAYEAQLAKVRPQVDRLGAQINELHSASTRSSASVTPRQQSSRPISKKHGTA
jgi:cell division septum initiation protein DivIVA